MGKQFIPLFTCKKVSFIKNHILSFCHFWYNHIFIHQDNTSVCFIPLYTLTPNFYIVKLGFTGVNIIFLIFALKHRLLVLRIRGF